MTEPTFTYKTATATDATNVKFGAPEINYLQHVLDGTHATDRIQIQHIERAASPWSYYVYQDGGVTYARRGDTGRAEFSDASNPRNPIQSAMDTAFAAFGRCVIYLAPQTFTFPAGSATTGANNALINIGTANGATLKSNISIIGAGMDKTIILNAKIHKAVATPSSNVLVSDLTLDAGANPIAQTSAGSPAHDNTTGFGTACAFDSYSSNFRLIRVKLQNSREELLNWTRMDRGLFYDCLFMNGGLAGASAAVRDNCAGSQQYYTDAGETARSLQETIFHNCHFYKSSASRGGNMLSTGRTGNLLITGCQFYNDDTNAAGGVICKNNATNGGLIAEVRVAFCRGNGPKMGIEVGDSTAGGAFVVEKAIIHGNTCTGTIAARKVDDVIIANNFVYNATNTGYIASANQRVKIHNCIAKNTNIRSTNTSADTDGGVYASDNKYTEIHHITVYDTRETRTSTTLNPVQSGVLTTPFGISVSAGSVSGNIVMIDNCNLLGDVSGSAASPFWFVGSDATTTGTAMRIRNHAEAIVNGGRVKGATSPAGDAIRLVTNTATGVSIRGVTGYNALGPAAVTVTASTFTYTNNDGVPEVLHIYGGTVTNVTKGGGVTIANTTPCNVWLEPGEAVGISYSAAPTVVKDRR